MYRQLPLKLQGLLRDFDSYGMPRTDWFQPRANLLIDDVSEVEVQGKSFLQARQLIMEGSSAGMFTDACFPGLGDIACGEHIPIAIHDMRAETLTARCFCGMWWMHTIFRKRAQQHGL